MNIHVAPAISDLPVPFLALCSSNPRCLALHFSNMDLVVFGLSRESQPARSSNTGFFAFAHCQQPILRFLPSS